MSIRQQKGAALLTVLLILVLLSTLAVYTAEDENIAIRRAENQRDAIQSHHLALAGEMWVINALERDALTAPLGVDYLSDEWALLQSDVVTVEDGQMAVQAVDESSKFNLNNLLVGKTQEIPDEDSAETPKPMKIVDSAWYAYFKRLLVNVKVDESLADAVLDWVDEDQKPSGTFGAEDAEYASADTPYLPANQAFSSISELSKVAQFSDDVLAKLSPYITALPVDKENNIFTKINMNTASDVVLSSLETSVDLPSLSHMMQSRLITPYNTIDLAYRALSLSLDKRDFNVIAAVNSEYFSAQSCVQFGRVQYALQSVVYREQSSQEALVISRQRRYNCGIVNSTLLLPTLLLLSE